MTEEEKLEPGPATTFSVSSSWHRLSRYLPLFLWVLLIFIASTGLMSASNTDSILKPVLHWLFPHASEATVNFIHLILRKGAHFTEYAILALLAARAFSTSSHESLRTHWFLVSLLLVVTYALSDEFHQSFVGSRTPSIYDCFIDSWGGLTALMLVALRRRRRSNRNRQALRLET
jgi:VanZ family protein